MLIRKLRQFRRERPKAEPDWGSSSIPESLLAAKCYTFCWHPQKKNGTKGEGSEKMCLQKHFMNVSTPLLLVYEPRNVLPFAPAILQSTSTSDITKQIEIYWITARVDGAKALKLLLPFRPLSLFALKIKGSFGGKEKVILTWAFLACASKTFLQLKSDLLWNENIYSDPFKVASGVYISSPAKGKHTSRWFILLWFFISCRLPLCYEMSEPPRVGEERENANNKKKAKLIYLLLLNFANFPGNWIPLQRNSISMNKHLNWQFVSCFTFRGGRAERFS